MFAPIFFACIAAVFGRHHPGIASHGHHHQANSQHTDSISPLIVGGNDTSATTWPWQANLNTGTGFMFCGGSIIQPNENGPYFVLTAAHCVENDNPSQVFVNFGQSYYNDKEFRQRVGVSKIIVHSQYNSRTFENDVALLVLSTQPEVSRIDIGPVTLASANDQLNGGDIMWATGFGTIASGGSTPDVLQQVFKPYVTDDDCARSYGRDFVRDKMICSGANGKDACQGDSGGPLVHKKEGENTFKLYGVVSWGIGCGHPDYPGVYANVRNYLQWIERNTSN
ncbi:trypsin-1-like isoform X1 [Argopecten irradians]|uniref:trypsin-1-like isoform X1 n=1 Tax=Argopecten irradians TaxID=31199 RepID=UPI0037173F49